MALFSTQELRQFTIFASAAMFVLAGVMTGLSSALVQIAAEYGIDPTRAGVLYSAHFSGFMVFVLTSSVATGLRRRVVITVAAAVAYVPALALAAHAPGFAWLTAALFVAGGAGGLLESHTATIQVVVTHTDAEATAVVAVTQMFFAVGALVIPLYLSVTAGTSSSWRLLFTALAAVAAVNALLALRIRTDRFGDVQEQHGTLNIPVLIRISVSLAFYVGAEITLFGWAPTVMELYRGIPAARARLSPSVFWIGMLAGRYLVARLTGRISPRSIMKVSAIGGIVAAVVMSTAPAEWLLWCAVVLAAVSCAGIWPLIVASSSTSGHEAGTILTVAAGAVGASIFPYLAGRTATFLPGTYIPLTAGVLLLAVLILNTRSPANAGQSAS